MNDAVPEAESAEPGIARPRTRARVRARRAAAAARGRTGRPGPPGTCRAPPTGSAEVDAGLERLADVDHLATDGHVEVYEDVHRGLRDALTALDARPGPPAPVRHPTITPR
ncbi:hypothetical protein GCM10019016_136680 [Streptomyces prasinosporus]|uniref:Uncharacterized protein n=1 Tax=Streptomyces prasinosporus TaxID=68256 RepID=A0ABP6UFL0_9ACTN